MDIFAKVIPQIRSGVAHQKQAAVVLQAVEQLIQEQGEQLTSTSYFACLVMLLEQELAEGNDVFPIVYLLTILMPQVEQKIYVAKSQDIANIFSVLFKMDDNQPLLRNSIFCAAQFLVKAKNKDLMKELMAFMVDKRPKIRKCAIDGMLSILEDFEPAHDFVVAFVTNILSSGDDLQILHTLTFLKRFVRITSTRYLHLI
jgi:ribosomal RNA-processing protein 12